MSRSWPARRAKGQSRGSGKNRRAELRKTSGCREAQGAEAAECDICLLVLVRQLVGKESGHAGAGPLSYRPVSPKPLLALYLLNFSERARNILCVYLQHKYIAYVHLFTKQYCTGILVPIC